MHTVYFFHLSFISSNLKGQPAQCQRFLIMNKPKQSVSENHLSHSAALSCSAGYWVHNPGPGSGEAEDLS